MKRYYVNEFRSESGNWLKGSETMVLADEAGAKIADLTEDRDLWKQSEASCAEHNRELSARCDKLEAALEVYAKKANWRRTCNAVGQLNWFIADTNGPYIALAALRDSGTEGNLPAEEDT
jgi:hypothetical protein